MGYNVHDVLKRVLFYYIKKPYFFSKSIFGYDLSFLSFKKMKHKISKELICFQIFKEKNMSST
jgi:hypothetical protein